MPNARVLRCVCCGLTMLVPVRLCVFVYLHSTCFLDAFIKCDRDAVRRGVRSSSTNKPANRISRMQICQRNGIWRHGEAGTTHTNSRFINIWDTLPAKCFFFAHWERQWDEINSIQLLWNPELLTLSTQTLANRSRVLPPFDKSADLWWLDADCDWKVPLFRIMILYLLIAKQTTCSSTRYSEIKSKRWQVQVITMTCCGRTSMLQIYDLHNSFYIRRSIIIANNRYTFFYQFALLSARIVCTLHGHLVRVDRQRTDVSSGFRRNRKSFVAQIAHSSLMS